MELLRVTGRRPGTNLKICTGAFAAPRGNRLRNLCNSFACPDFKRTWEKILFPGNKKVRFFDFFPEGEASKMRSIMKGQNSNEINALKASTGD
jgi:hypothetical protein